MKPSTLATLARAVLPLLLGLCGGCHSVEPCREHTIFVALTIPIVDGALTPDHLQVSVRVGDQTLQAANVGYAQQRSYGLQIEFPGGYPAGKTVDIEVDAVHGGTVVASGSVVNRLTTQCVQLALALTPTSAFGPNSPCQGACQLNALSPPVAQTGDLVTLEGNFGGSAVVHFPGGADVAGTVLGPGRIGAVVPALATAGPLTVTTAGSLVGPLPFRRAAFTLGLSRFEIPYPQTSGARQTTQLATARQSFTAVNTGAFVYAIGGRDASGAILSTSERATINADETLSSFTAVAGGSLAVGRTGLTSVLAGDSLYVLGGCAASFCPTSIERATRDGGALGPFATLGVQLTTPRDLATSVVIGDFVYVLGGRTSSGGAAASLATIERATIQSDGTLSAFSVVTGSALTAPRFGHVSAVVGGYLYVLGGVTGALTTSVERATINPDGTLSPFAAIDQEALVSVHDQAAVSVFGGSLCVLGGGYDTSLGEGTLATIECASLAADGTLAPFATSEWHLPVDVYGHAAVVVGSSLYTLGGHRYPSALGTVQHSSLDTSGLFGASAATGTSFVVARSGHTDAVLGNTLYAIGGKHFASDGTTACNGGACTLGKDIEQATIGADGSLGAPATYANALVAARFTHGSAIIGSSVYAVGGVSTSTTVATVERASFDGNGVLSAFKAVSGVNLVTARAGFATVVTCSMATPQACALYVIGGADAMGTNLTSVERATIGADGSLSTFAAVTGVSLAQARLYPSSFVAGGYVNILGGCQAFGAPVGSIERAKIADDGTLGPFAVATAATLATARCGQSSVAIGPTLYLVGGFAGTKGYLDGIEASGINGDGQLAPFVPVALPMTSARQLLTAALFGNALYLLGGDASSSLTLASIESASLQ